jgi:hypothetical protein
MDGTGISFEPFGKVLPQDVHVKVIQYPTDRLLSFEETVQCARDQIQSAQEDAIVLAESFSDLLLPVGSDNLSKCLTLFICRPPSRYC